jgi:hypothetical protein
MAGKKRSLSRSGHTALNSFVNHLLQDSGPSTSNHVRALDLSSPLFPVFTLSGQNAELLSAEDLRVSGVKEGAGLLCVGVQLHMWKPELLIVAAVFIRDALAASVCCK